MTAALNRVYISTRIPFSGCQHVILDLSSIRHGQESKSKHRDFLRFVGKKVRPPSEKAMEIQLSCRVAGPRS